MANIKSAEKRWRQSLKRRLRNRSVRTTARTYVKATNRTIAAGEPDTDALKLAVRALDKAAEKGIIHPNNAARRKSRLMSSFSAAVVAQSAPAVEAPATGRRRAASGGATRSRSTAGTRRATTSTTTRAPRSRTPKS